MIDYHGHMTMADGSRVALSSEEAERLVRACKEAEAKSAADTPTTAEAVREMQRARERLRRLGWRDGVYCPKDGSTFAVIQYDSTGIFEAHYSGEWPSGFVYCCDGIEHPKGMMFKALADLTNAEREKLDDCMASERAHHDRMVANMIATDDQS